MFPNIEDKLNLDFSVGFSIASLPSQRNAEKHFFIQIRIYFIFWYRAQGYDFKNNH